MISTRIPGLISRWLVAGLALVASACHDSRYGDPFQVEQVFEVEVDGERIEAGCAGGFGTVSTGGWSGPYVDTYSCELNGLLVGELPAHVRRVSVSAQFSSHVFEAGEPMELDLSDPSSIRFVRPEVSISAPGEAGAYAIYGARAYDEDRWIEGASGTVVVGELGPDFHEYQAEFDVELRDLVLVKIESSEAPGAEIWPETIRVPYAAMRRFVRGTRR